MHISVFFCEVANHFVAVRKILVVKGIVLVVEGLNIINLYAIYDQVTGPEQPIFVVLCVQYESKKGGKDQESIQSSTTPDPGYQMGNQFHLINFKNSLSLDFELLRILILILCILSKLTEVSICSRI